MKSILFVMRYYVGRSNDHLTQKYRNQINAAKSLGYDVWYLGCNDKTIYLYHNDESYELVKICTAAIPILSNILLYRCIYKSINRVLFMKSDFTYVYARSMFPIRQAFIALKNLKACGTKIIMEIPTYPPMKEYITEKRKLRKFLLITTDKMSLKLAQYVDLYVLVGEKSDTYCGKPAINIENGTDVLSTPVKKERYKDEYINLLALASMARWHGYDRIIEGLNKFRMSGGSEKIMVYFVGPDGDGSLIEWKRLAENYNLSDCVAFEGAKYGDELSAYFDICDIGVASIGIHRLDINKAFVLKIREYMARGLPFIYATNDEALEDNSEFHIKVPDDESPLDMNKVIAFAEKVKADPSIHEKMRKFALQNMTWEKQFEKIFGWFDEYEV